MHNKKQRKLNKNMYRSSDHFFKSTTILELVFFPKYQIPVLSCPPMIKTCPWGPKAQELLYLTPDKVSVALVKTPVFRFRVIRSVLFLWAANTALFVFLCKKCRKMYVTESWGKLRTTSCVPKSALRFVGYG